MSGVKVIPYGAAGGEVTGSCYLVETRQCKVVVDCGLFQGGHGAEERNRTSIGPDLASVDAVLLTHAHLDHTGRLPLLTKAGYRGPIYATPATIELTALILRDSAKLQAQDVERQNRKLQRAGRPLIEPLYTVADAEIAISLLQPVPSHIQVAVASGVEAYYAEAGHMLGSASIKLTIRDEAQSRKVVFSGDLGPKTAPILREYEPFTQADAVFVESTYGDHHHRPFTETVEEFLRILKDAVADKGKILVPTFAVGRAQVLTILLAWAFRNGMIEPFPVYLDSPMANEAWKIYRRHVELFDEDMTRFLNSGSIEHDLATMQSSVTAEDSKRINEVPGPCLVLAGAGMCTGGRILHHLKQNLWRTETHVVIVGYQAQGSLGRMLVDGVKRVRLFGEEIAVRARVHTLGGFSAHADQTDLISWFKPLAQCNPQIFLTHGEDDARQELAKLLRQDFGASPVLPDIKQALEIRSNASGC